MERKTKMKTAEKIRISRMIKMRLNQWISLKLLTLKNFKSIRFGKTRIMGLKEGTASRVVSSTI